MEKNNKNAHIVLLGDSIFDNAVYVPQGKSVIKHLETKIPPQWKATLRAVDGNVISHIHRQAKKIPSDASHLFISIGGNDALRVQYKVQSNVRTIGEALIQMHDIKKVFQEEYRKMLDEVLTRKLPTTLCTIYNPNFGNVEQQTVAVAGLTILNDVIIEEAVNRGLPLMDLKTMFNDASFYANPIEPGDKGGEVIANTIVKVVKEHDFVSNSCTIYK